MVRARKNLGEKLKDLGVERPEPFQTQPRLLLSDNVPMPLHGVAPRIILGTPWWNRTRKAAYLSTGYRCLACGVSLENAKARRWLEGHEVYTILYRPGRMFYERTVPLCHYCHNYVHDGRLASMLESGEIHHSKYVAIIQHGDSVLASIGLKRPSLEERVRKIEKLGVAPWSKWRLVLFGKLYLPKYKSRKEWEKHFDG